MTPATNAPLAAVLYLATDQYSRVSVSVDDGQSTWQRDFYDYATNHWVPLLGFRAARANVITVTVHDRFGNEVTAAQPLVFHSPALPGNFPPTVLLKREPEKMEPGYMLFVMTIRNANNLGVVTVADDAGQVVWYSGTPCHAEVRQLDNGNLFIPIDTNFAEVNLLGDRVDNWVVPKNLSIDLHDGVPTDHGTILYLNDAIRTVTNLPTSATNPAARLQTTNVVYNRVVEISATNGAVLNIWSPIDFLDPTRIDYLSLTYVASQGFDVEHANAVLEDPRDDSIIVSLRHQDAVVKFSRTTGQPVWILGPHANWGPLWQPYLLTPEGTPFEWNYAQHTPLLTPEGTLLVYDDGVFRASPFDPPLADSNTYSRAVEYKIDEKTMTISQVWDYGRTNEDRFYTPIIGSAFPLPRTGNILVDFGYVTYVDGLLLSRTSPNASMARIREVTHGPNPEVVFDVAYFDFQNTNRSYQGSGIYRSHWIPDLYPVLRPARAIADLMMAVGGSGTAAARDLMPDLGAAVNAVGVHDGFAAVRWLHAFQDRIPCASLDAETATEFVHEAQGIMDALDAGKSTYATERLSSVFPVFVPSHGIAELIDAVGDAFRHDDRSLIGRLSAALTSLGENHPAAAVRDLLTFQTLLRAGGLNPKLADRLSFQARRIMDAIRQGPDEGRIRLCISRGKRGPHLEFPGNVMRAYSVEASADLVHWRKIGAARPTHNGNFEFEDAHSAEFRARYYRVVSP